MAQELEWIHVPLPGGGTATVVKNARPETLAALDELLRLAAASTNSPDAAEQEAITRSNGNLSERGAVYGSD